MARSFLSLLIGALMVARLGAEGPAVDFNRDVRPILSDNCFKCHGPDEAERKARLRLDDRAAALKREAFVPGDASASELVARLVESDPNKRMPPAKTGKKLSPAQIDILKRWIDQGATYSAHWAFVPPRRPAVPTVADARHPIDAFIRHRLAREGLKPSDEADRATLLRRLTFDLTGMPPTPEELDAFLNDRSPQAYERLVDRLMKSPRYGERMALDWLDAARFADTHGFHIDSGRDMTRWREWVIEAFNRNMPYDQFTIEQLAGDLLPNATLDQKIASGFNRNHMINFEGGAIPEEYHTAYIVDRVNTTATVWLGLSVACAQCHDHKYDPISQKDYYRLFAFFHNVPENGLDGSKGNAMPFVKAPTALQTRRLEELASRITTLQQQLVGPMPEADADQPAWEAEAMKDAAPLWRALTASAMNSPHGTKLVQNADHLIRATGPNPAKESYTLTFQPDSKRITALKLEVLPDPKTRLVGRSENGNFVLTEVRVTGAAIQNATASFSQQSYPIAHAIDGKPGTGWAIFPQPDRPHSAIFVLDRPWIAKDDEPLIVTFEFDSHFGQHQFGTFRVAATDSEQPLGQSALPDAVRQALAVPVEQRTPAQTETVRSYYRQHVAPASRELAKALAEVQKERTELEKNIPTVMVMEEMAKPRDTFVLIRGAYDKKGEQVTAGVPEALGSLPPDTPPNRLGLARWLVSPDHPLTARVAVNRYWQMFFGTGLVKTAEDFGSQGEHPSHPELLDWLAVHFRESGWDVKALVRMIVTSMTYRQASTVSPEQLARDPENRWLARQSRLRLQAEFIRDQALSVSGLLNGEIGGKSVFPYQPPGLWEELMSRADGANWTAQTYTPGKGRDLYRRTMYTFWKRTCPPPTLATFDAPDREVCTIRRPRTNTPLQALVLMNDPTYVEAARKLAERLLREANTTDERLILTMRLCVSRTPSAEELAVLRPLYESRLAKYRADEAAALKLLQVGESPRDDALPPAELAAWTSVASVILNLDETVTRN